MLRAFGDSCSCIASQVTKVKGVASSLAAFLNTLPEGDTSGEIVDDWVDVRDVAVQHVLALSTPAAGGERIISAARTPSLFSVSNV